MTLEIVEYAEYTPEIQACVERLMDRMAYTNTDYELDDVLVAGDGDTVFVLANPVLGEERMADGERIPMRNITLVYYDGPPEPLSPGPDFSLNVRLPRLRVLRPDLCLKLAGDQVIDCGVSDLESAMVVGWEEQLRRLLSTLWSPGPPPGLWQSEEEESDAEQLS